MRLLPLIAFLAACSSDPGTAFLYSGYLDAETEGVRLLDDGSGWAGMVNQLCHFDLQNGEVTGETELGADREVLLDAWGGATLARADARLVRLDAVGEPTQDLGLEVLNARLTSGGITALIQQDQACAVAWLPEGGEAYAFAVPEAVCGAGTGFAVDRETGAAWVADGVRLARMNPDGTFALHPAATTDLVALDAASGHALVGARGGSFVQAVNPAGEVVWNRDLMSPLLDLEAAGRAGTVALLAEVDRGADLELLDASSGAPSAVYGLPEKADIQLSGDARWLGLVVPDGVHLYEVDPDVRLLDTPSVSRTGTVNPWVGPSAAGAGSGVLAGVAVAVAILVD
jgi:hypothetical protein